MRSKATDRDVRAAAILAQAEQALAEGDLPRARALVDAVLAQKPRHAGARELRAAIDELAPFHDPAEPDAHTQDFGDLQPDARHVAPAPPPREPLRGNRYDPGDERPLGVTLLAILDIIVGAIMLLLGVLAGGAIGLFTVLLGGLVLASGIGLWRLRPWAWTLSVVATGAGFALNVLGGVAGNGRAAFTAIIQGLLLAYLWAVREHFRSPTSSRAPFRTRA